MGLFLVAVDCGREQSVRCPCPATLQRQRRVEIRVPSTSHQSNAAQISEEPYAVQVLRELEGVVRALAPSTAIDGFVMAATMLLLLLLLLLVRDPAENERRYTFDSDGRRAGINFALVCTLWLSTTVGRHRETLRE